MSGGLSWLEGSYLPIVFILSLLLPHFFFEYADAAKSFAAFEYLYVVVIE